MIEIIQYWIFYTLDNINTTNTTISDKLGISTRNFYPVSGLTYCKYCKNPWINPGFMTSCHKQVYNGLWHDSVINCQKESQTAVMRQLDPMINEMTTVCCTCSNVQHRISWVELTSNTGMIDRPNINWLIIVGGFCQKHVQYNKVLIFRQIEVCIFW